jgi:hypothetical protein
MYMLVMFMIFLLSMIFLMIYYLLPRKRNTPSSIATNPNDEGEHDYQSMNTFEEMDTWLSTKNVINMGIHVCVNSQTLNQYIVGERGVARNDNAIWDYFSNLINNDSNTYLVRDLRVRLSLQSVKYYTNIGEHPWKREDVPTSNEFRRHIIDHCGYKLLNEEALFTNATDTSYPDITNAITSWTDQPNVNENDLLTSYFSTNYIDRSRNTDLENKVISYFTDVSKVWMLHYTNSGSGSPPHLTGPAKSWDNRYEGPWTFGASLDTNTFVHEFCHSMGGKHPQDVDVGDGHVEKGSYEKARGINYNSEMCSFHQPQGGVWGLSMGVDPKSPDLLGFLKSQIKHCDASAPNGQVAFIRKDDRVTTQSFIEETGFQCDHLHPWKWKNEYITSLNQIEDMNTSIDSLDIIDNLPCNKRDHGMDKNYGPKRLLYGELYPIVSHNQQIDYGPVQCNEEVDERTDMDQNRMYRNLPDSSSHKHMEKNCILLNNTGHWQRNMHGRTGGSCMGYSHYQHPGFLPNEVQFIRNHMERLIEEADQIKIRFPSPYIRNGQTLTNVLYTQPEPVTSIDRPIQFFYDTANSGLVLIQSGDKRTAYVYANMYAHTMVNKRCDLFKAKFEVLYSGSTEPVVKTCLNHFRPSNINTQTSTIGINKTCTITVKRPYKLNFEVNELTEHSNKGNWVTYKRNYLNYPHFSTIDESAVDETIFHGFYENMLCRKIPIVKLEFSTAVTSLGIFINYMTAVATDELIGMDEPLIVNRNGVVRSTDYNPTDNIHENSIETNHSNVLVRYPPFPGHVSLPPYSNNYYEMYADKANDFKLSNLKMIDGSLLGDSDQIVFQQNYVDINVTSDRVTFRNNEFLHSKDTTYAFGNTGMPSGYFTDTDEYHNTLKTNSDDLTEDWSATNYETLQNRIDCRRDGNMSVACLNMTRITSTETVL